MLKAFFHSYVNCNSKYKKNICTNSRVKSKDQDLNSFFYFRKFFFSRRFFKYKCRMFKNLANKELLKVCLEIWEYLKNSSISVIIY